MASPKHEATKDQTVQGRFSTSEVTYILETLRIEGQNYLKNHVLMALAGSEGALRQWHDNVTRANIQRLRPLAREMGIDLPYARPLEERENEMKEKLKAGGPSIRATLTEGEALAEVVTYGARLTALYAHAMTIASGERVRDAFRSCFEAAADHLPRVEQALKGTDSYYPPPLCREVGLLAEKGVSP